MNRISFAIMAAFANANSTDGKCRVLALRGGGTHGSFEVGVLKAFLAELDPSEIKWDYVSGVSVGAINGSFLALHPPGDERKAIQELEDLYMNYLP